MAGEAQAVQLEATTLTQAIDAHYTIDNAWEGLWIRDF